MKRHHATSVLVITQVQLMENKIPSKDEGGRPQAGGKLVKSSHIHQIEGVNNYCIVLPPSL